MVGLLGCSPIISQGRSVVAFEGGREIKNEWSLLGTSVSIMLYFLNCGVDHRHSGLKKGCAECLYFSPLDSRPHSLVCLCVARNRG